jgi:hypothetical protein
MKSRFLPIAGYVFLNCALAACGVAAAEAAKDAGPAGPVQNPPPKAKLPYGADDVVRLSAARVNEEVILNYIQTSGTIYNLTPQDIVRLRDEGVSDRVINAMIDQRRVVPIHAPRKTGATQPLPPSAPGRVRTVYVAQPARWSFRLRRPAKVTSTSFRIRAMARIMDPRPTNTGPPTTAGISPFTPVFRALGCGTWLLVRRTFPEERRLRSGGKQARELRTNDVGRRQGGRERREASLFRSANPALGNTPDDTPACVTGFGHVKPRSRGTPIAHR